MDLGSCVQNSCSLYCIMLPLEAAFRSFPQILSSTHWEGTNELNKSNGFWGGGAPEVRRHCGSLRGKSHARDHGTCFPPSEQLVSLVFGEQRHWEILH